MNNIGRNINNASHVQRTQLSTNQNRLRNNNCLIDAILVSMSRNESAAEVRQDVFTRERIFDRLSGGSNPQESRYCFNEQELMQIASDYRFNSPPPTYSRSEFARDLYHNALADHIFRQINQGSMLDGVLATRMLANHFQVVIRLESDFANMMIRPDDNNPNVETVNIRHRGQHFSYSGPSLLNDIHAQRAPLSSDSNREHIHPYTINAVQRNHQINSNNCLIEAIFESTGNPMSASQARQNIFNRENILNTLAGFEEHHLIQIANDYQFRQPPMSYTNNNVARDIYHNALADHIFRQISRGSMLDGVLAARMIANYFEIAIQLRSEFQNMLIEPNCEYHEIAYIRHSGEHFSSDPIAMDQNSRSSSMSIDVFGVEADDPHTTVNTLEELLNSPLCGRSTAEIILNHPNATERIQQIAQDIIDFHDSCSFLNSIVLNNEVANILHSAFSATNHHVVVMNDIFFCSALPVGERFRAPVACRRPGNANMGTFIDVYEVSDMLDSPTSFGASFMRNNFVNLVPNNNGTLNIEPYDNLNEEGYLFTNLRRQNRENLDNEDLFEVPRQGRIEAQVPRNRERGEALANQLRQRNLVASNETSDTVNRIFGISQESGTEEEPILGDNIIINGVSFENTLTRMEPFTEPVGYVRSDGVMDIFNLSDIELMGNQHPCTREIFNINNFVNLDTILLLHLGELPHGY